MKTLRTHPKTGRRLGPVGYRRDGRPIYPILGAADGDGDADAKAKAEAEEKAKAEADAKAKAEAEEKAKAEAEAKGEGFPADTAPEDMTQEQQTAYWKHQARRHEQSAKRLGDVTLEQYKAQQTELEQLRRDKMSDSDKALDDARKAGREEERKALQPKMVQAAFDAAIGTIDDEDEAKAVRDMVDALDFGSFITDDGAVDTARVQSVAGRITGSAIARPATSGYGGGRRSSTQASGVEAGREMFETSRRRTKTA